MKHSLTWIEISADNLKHNISTFKKLIGADRILCPAVKGNAYGHGLTVCAPIMVEAGADFLSVNALFEAVELRKVGIKVPIYIMGYIPFEELSIAVNEGFRFAVFNLETMKVLDEITKKNNKSAFTHLMVETGLSREGVLEKDLDLFLDFYKNNSLILLEGVGMHFANFEDTTDHSYAHFQLENFDRITAKIKAAGLNPKYTHSANTAATVLLDKTHFNFVRTGIGNYGLWPSDESFNSAKNRKDKFDLKPVLSWKTRVAQIKEIPADSFIGYGCTYKTNRPSKIAILPVGYYDGIPRKISNHGYVLIDGKRAQIRGRVCMNMTMVDVTEIPNVKIEDEVVLIGKQMDEEISANQMASWADTIHYEITTRLNENIERKVV